MSKRKTSASHVESSQKKRKTSNPDPNILNPDEALDFVKTYEKLLMLTKQLFSTNKNINPFLIREPLQLERVIPSFFNFLSNEILVHILSFVPCDTKTFLVNRTWREANLFIAEQKYKEVEKNMKIMYPMMKNKSMKEITSEELSIVGNIKETSTEIFKRGS